MEKESEEKRALKMNEGKELGNVGYGIVGNEDEDEMVEI
jgi:hypothetical protein